MNKVFLFDFDGTIADSLETLVLIFNDLVDTFHLPRKVEKNEVEQLRKLHLRQLIKDFGISPLKLPFIIYEVRKRFTKKVPSLKLFPGIKDSLQQLKEKNIILGIVTSNSVENVELFLEKNDMHMFNIIHSEKGLFGKHKVLQNLLRTYKLEKENVIYIGDEVRDVDAAKKAGLKIAAVTWGANAKEALIKAKPDYLINKPSELLNLV